MNYTEGTQILDGWTIIRKLGSGSFGTVYQIERKDEYGICERSALKVISVPQSPEDMKEILDDGMNDREASTYFNSVMRDIVREVAVMVEMKNCAHIVRYEAHKVIPHEDGIGGDILIRMELLTSLPEYRRTHEMNENDVIRMGRDLADALMYCERKGLIHRDIKPQNIFVTENGDFKLGDFGIARRMQRTTGASRKGTEDYMAPEVYLRRHYGTTVDIYSLGLVMYKYTNYGRLPFLPLPPTPPSFDDREQALQNRMNGVPIPPPAEAEERLSAIILKECAYDSAQRYRNAGELKAKLEELLSGGSTIKGEEEKPVDSEDVVHPVDPEDVVDPNEHPSEDRSEKTVGGWPEKEDRSEKTVGGWPEKEERSDKTVGGWPEEEDHSEKTVGGWPEEKDHSEKVVDDWIIKEERTVSDESDNEQKGDQHVEPNNKQEETYYEKLHRELDKEGIEHHEDEKPSRFGIVKKHRGLFLFGIAFIIVGAIFSQWIAAQNDKNMKASWEKVADLVFSSFVEGGREYMEMPIGEITRVVEARGFEGADVDGEHNFAYSGSAQYELKTDQTEMVKLSVWHESIDDPYRREQVYRFIEYEYQDFYYNEEMQSTLRKLDLPYAVYFGDTKEEIMGTLGITEEMQEWCQSESPFDLREFLLSSKLGTVYYMGSTDQNNEETVIAVGKDCMVFAMSFRADGSIAAVGIGNLKYAAMAEAMHERKNIIDSWMYLDGYPLGRISFETYEEYLLSICDIKEKNNPSANSDDTMYHFFSESEKEDICFTIDSSGEEVYLYYNRNIWNDEKQNTFALQSGIPQEVVQILSEVPEGMTEKEYFVSQMGDAADYIDVFDGNNSGSNLQFDEGKLSALYTWYHTIEKVTPVGGLAASYLQGRADQRTIYDSVSWVKNRSWGENKTYDGECGIIYLGEDEDCTEIYRKNGDGTLWLDNGDHYTGEFVDSLYNGEGTYYWAKGSYVTGQWAGDDRNGVCTQYDSDGNISLEGIWFNDEFIGGFK